jgi:hypothetical protein
VPEPDAGDWPTRLRLLDEETSRVLAPYPGIDAMMIDLGLPEQGRRLMDANVQILLDEGLRAVDYRTFGYAAIVRGLQDLLGTGTPDGAPHSWP